MRAPADLVDHVLQPVLEFALHAGPGLQQPHVEHVQLHALQHLRHVTLGDAAGQALNHRGLAHAGLAGEDRIVLAPAQQDIDQLADLGIAANHRVDVAVTGALGEVGGELVQRRRLRQPAFARQCLAVSRLPRGIREINRLAGLLRALGHAGEVVLELFPADARELLGAPFGQLRQLRLGQQRQQQVAAADAGGPRVQRGQQPGVLEQRRQVLGEHRGAGVAGAEAVDLGRQVLLQRARSDPAAARHQREVAARLLHQRQEQMLQVDFPVAPRHAQAGGALGRLAAGVVEFADQSLEIDGHVWRNAPCCLQCTWSLQGMDSVARVRAGGGRRPC